MGRSIPRLLHLMLWVAVVDASPHSLKHDCEALHDPPNQIYAYYERSHCFVFNTKDRLDWANATDACATKYLPSPRYNGGMAMWIAYRGVRAWMIENILEPHHMLYGLFSIATTMTDHPEVRIEYYDEKHYGQDREFGDPKWWSKSATNRLFMKYHSMSLTTPIGMEGRTCEYLKPGDSARSDLCDGPTLSLRIGYICQYEEASTAYIVAKKEWFGSRLRLQYTVQRATVTLGECRAMFWQCTACNSFAYASTTSDCRLYIPDDRFINWATSLWVDPMYRIYQYVE